MLVIQLSTNYDILIYRKKTTKKWFFLTWMGSWPYIVWSWSWRRIIVIPRSSRWKSGWWRWTWWSTRSISWSTRIWHFRICLVRAARKWRWVPWVLRSWRWSWWGLICCIICPSFRFLALILCCFYLSQDRSWIYTPTVKLAFKS